MIVQLIVINTLSTGLWKRFSISSKKLRISGFFHEHPQISTKIKTDQLFQDSKKLNVNYIVEGSGQKYGNKFVLRVQLLVAKNEDIYGEIIRP